MEMMKKPKVMHEPDCKCGQCMSKGGEVKGVHEDYKDRNPVGYQEGQSKAGDQVRWASATKESHPKTAYVRHLDAAKEEHRRVLDESRSMPNPNIKGLAHGGEVEGQDELHDMIGNEIMEGIHSKDHKKLMGGIEAMVLRCLNKKEE